MYDAVVIGAGPAGITAALYLVRSGLKTALIESSAAGGQILSTAEIENYPGFPKSVKGWELADLFEAHLASYPVERLRGEVSSIQAHAGGSGPFRIILAEGDAVEAKTVIACSGARHRRLGAPGEDTYAGMGVSYCAVCDGNFYRGREVAVVGGGNSALEEALYLSRIASKVWLIHRRSSFRGSMVYQDKIRTAENVEVITDTVIDEIRGSKAGMEGLAIRNTTSGELRTLPVDGLFIYVGMDPVSGFLPDGVEKDQAGFVVTDGEMRTSIPGLFAAGDVRSKHCRQVSTAVGDGATAAMAALAYVEQSNA